MLTIADDLHARGIGVKILTGKLSGSYSPTGEGKFFFCTPAHLMPGASGWRGSNRTRATPSRRTRFDQLFVQRMREAAEDG